MHYLPPAAIAPPLGTFRAFELMNPDPGIQGRWDPPKSLMESNYLQALETFQLHDSNKDGTLDPTEFRKLMLSLNPGRADYGEIDLLFNEVDVAHEGEISFPRFLCWLFCNNGHADRRPTRDGQVKEQRAVTIATPASPTSPVSPTSCPSTGSRGHHPRRMSASPTRLPSISIRPNLTAPSMTEKEEPVPLGAPIVIKVVYEPSFKIQLGGIMRALRPVLHTCKVITRTSSRARGLDSVIARVGSGIVLWDRATMAMHFEYPFRSIQSSMDWCDELMRTTLPTLFKTNSLCDSSAQSQLSEDDMDSPH